MKGTSGRYATAQTLLVCAFAAAYFLAPGPRLVPQGGAIGIVGSALCLGGVVLLLWALVSLRGVVQIAPEPRAGARLVTNGPYARLRHPIYSAIVSVLIGLFLRQPTVVVGIGAAVVIVFLTVKARFEERLLLARYPEYAEYMARTQGVHPWERPRRDLPRA